MSVIGTFRKVKAGTKFWHLGLQENVKSDRDIIIEITQTCVGNNFIFGFKTEKNMFAENGLMRNKASEMMIDFSKTEEYVFTKNIIDIFHVEPVYGNKSDKIIHENTTKFFLDKFHEFSFQKMAIPKERLEKYDEFLPKIEGQEVRTIMTFDESHEHNLKLAKKINHNSFYPIRPSRNYMFIDPKLAEEIIELGKKNIQEIEESMKTFSKDFNEKFPNGIV